jgi:Subtilase family/Peptidase inhibitor I9
MGISHRRAPQRLGLAAGLAAASMVLAGAAGNAATAVTQPNATAASTRVIVLLNSQSGSASAAEAPVLSQVRASGASHVVTFDAVASFAATVSANEAVALSANPAVASVVPDNTVTVAPPTSAQAPTTPAPRKAAPHTAASVPANVCPADPNKPLIEPEGLQTIHAAQAQAAGVTGKGVTVAYIADGVNPNNADFIRPNGQHVFTNYVDFSGEGPNAPSGGAEAFGDASTIAAQGRQVYDLSDFVNAGASALPKGCNIKILGVAPGASILGLKAGGALFSNSAILQSIDYAIHHHVNVLNESFGSNAYPDNSNRDTIQLFNDAAVKAGITVTVSTGDAGVTGTQGTPSTDPNVISAAASTDSQTYAQTGYAAFKFSNGKWVNNNISALSSGGISQGGRVPDLVAPGEADWSLCDNTKLSDGSLKFGECTNYQGAGAGAQIQPFGGTSQSAPMTAGTAALVIQAFRDSHHGQSPSPALVKQFIVSTTQDLNVPASEQGAGLIDADAAVKAAQAYKGTGKVAAGETLVSPSQATLRGKPGAAAGTEVSVTNTGTKAETVKAGTRSYATVAGSSHSATASINAATDPTFVYATTGAPWAYKKVTFKVAKGADRLSATIAWKGDNKLQSDGSTVGKIVRLTLLDPHGTYEANSRPQGGAVSPNHSFIDVRNPTAGTWTAILYTPQSGAQAYTGSVLLADSTQNAVKDGSVSPSSLKLKAGQSGHFKVSTHIDGDHGDASEAVTIATSNGQHSSVPIVTRPIIPISKGKGNFTGTITGGNARDFAPTETLTYAFDVPAGTHDLNLGLNLNSDRHELIEGALLDPDGEAIDVSSNATSFDQNGNVVDTGWGLQLAQSAPEKGRWRFVLIATNAVSGQEVSQGFRGTIRLNTVKVSAKLPSSAKSKLTAGKASNFTVKYTNNGAAAMPVLVDPRLTKVTNVTLAPLFGPATVPLPITTTFPPAYLVPPGTQSFSLQAKSSLPAQVETQGPLGMPDVYGAESTTSTARVTEAGGRHQVARGLWGSFVQEIGPFTDAKPAQPGTTTLTGVARTQAFDTTVTSSTGDAYAASIGENSPFNPVVVSPGKTGSVTVTIKPSGKKGSVVSGVLYLTTTPGTYNGHMGAVSTSGDVIAAIPYTYTIG